ncbi:MAG: hypothetical protein WC858_04235 [Parcubacteria group bacterium]
MGKLNLEDLNQLILAQAKEKGFRVKPVEMNVPEKIALIHSEISEAYEAYRHKKFRGKDNFAEELADAIIRIIHLGGVYGANLEKEILKKMKTNQKINWDWNKMNEKHA